MRKHAEVYFPKLQVAAELLHRTRGFVLILILVTASGYILAYVPQGQDLLRTVTDVNRDHSSGFSFKVFWLCLSVVALGFQGWFWGRTIADRYTDYAGNWLGHVYLTWVPRLLGLIPFGLLFIALWRVQTPGAWPAWILLVLGLLFLIFLWTRKAAVRRMRSTSDKLASQGKTRAAAVIDRSLRNIKPLIFWGGIGYAAIAMIVVTLDPVTFSVYFGPGAVVLTACALLIPVLATLSLLGNTFHVRVVEALFVLIVVTSLWVDNHEVRHSPSLQADQTAAIKARPTLEQAYQSWRGQFPSDDGHRQIPMIFVASEGGASRAGYWTAAVMSRLEASSNGEFSKHVFAVSSISGGSLGVGGFLASIRDSKTHEAIEAGKANLPQVVSEFVGRDYLSPALAGGMFPDFLQRFLPVAVFPDRSAALEKGWEAGWRSRCDVTPCDDNEQLQHDFLSLWKGGPSGSWLPAWLIGGALEEDGRPILTSNIDFGDAIDAWDFHDVAQRDVRLSTAILNGARFPIVSSSGTIRNPALPQKTKAVHIVDGGYFDAAGVETVRGLARRMFGVNGIAANDNVEPIFLLLSNDGVNPPFAPSTRANIMPGSTPVACRGQTVKSGCPGGPGLATVVPDLFGPLQGLFRSRGAHGEKLKTLLYLDPPTRANIEPLVLTMDLCSLDVPMNWALSPNAKRIVDELLDNRTHKASGSCEERNDMDFDRLTALLSSSAELQ